MAQYPSQRSIEVSGDVQSNENKTIGKPKAKLPAETEKSKINETERAEVSGPDIVEYELSSFDNADIINGH